VPEEAIRFGISGQLPMIVSSPATIKVRLPSDVALDGASIQGDRAHVKFELPAIVRLGVELRPIEKLRVEVAYVHEFWSSHDTIVATPEGITLAGIKGAPSRVAMPQIVIPRNFQDTNSVRIGGEYSIDFEGYRFDVRAGLSWESSAVPPAYLSLSSLDFPKYTVGFGGGLHIGRWRFDGVYAHTFAGTTYISSDQAQIPRINPLKGNAPLEAVNGGTYRATSDLIGVGFAYSW
jgi:long-chain fatty acid transport protein